MKKFFSIVLISILMLGSCSQKFTTSSQQTRQYESNKKHRMIVLTDIEADPDDTQTLIRLLLYSNVIDIKGLIATTSVWQKKKVAPE